MNERSFELMFIQSAKYIINKFKIYFIYLTSGRTCDYIIFEVGINLNLGKFD